MRGDASRFERIGDLFERARHLPPESRAGFLDAQCSGDGRMRSEIDSLLRYHDTADNLFDGENPPVSLMRRDDQPPDASIPHRIGDFRIIRVLGEGGMGIVYLAEQEHPARRVAVKVIKPGLASRRILKRFQYEAEFLGRLSHPGIAQVFEAGTFDDGSGGRPYIAMEYVEGAPLTNFAAAHGLSMRERLDLFLQVTDAVSHAHQRGVVHRDLKPGNILVNDERGAASDEPQRHADQQPITAHQSSHVKILDFGIARAVDPEAQVTTLQTSAGEMIGTLAYMSPEQIEGDPNLDVRSDVYALGVILYEMLADRLPYELRNRTVARAVAVIAEAEPIPIASIDRAYRGDVATIVHKALEKDPDRRYASALELAGDVRRFLHDEPIAARPATAVYRIRKFAKRNRALVAGGVIAFIALLAGTVGTTIGMIRARGEADRARAVSDFMEGILSEPSPERSGVDVRLVDILTGATDEVETRFAGHPQEQIRVYQMIGRGLRNISLLEESVAPHRRAYEIALAEYGPADHRTILARTMLADQLRGANRFVEAAAISREILELLPTSQHATDECALSARRIIAIEQITRREYAPAEGDLRALVRDSMEAYGPDHPATIAAHIALATLLRNRASQQPGDMAAADLKEAAAILQAHFDRFEASKRLAGINELSSYLLLVSTLIHLGRMDETERVLQRFDAAAEGRLGLDHSLRADALEARARVHASREECDLAAECLIAAVDINRARSGDLDPFTLSTMGDGLAILEAGGAFERGEEYTRLLARVMRSHGGVQRYQLFLARFLSAQGRFGEADALFEPLRTDEEVASTPGLACLLALFLGEHELAQGRREEAARLFAEAEHHRSRAPEVYIMPTKSRIERAMRSASTEARDD